MSNITEGVERLTCGTSGLTDCVEALMFSQIARLTVFKR